MNELQTEFIVLREDRKKCDGSFHVTHNNLPLVSDYDYNMTTYCFIPSLKVTRVIFGNFEWPHFRLRCFFTLSPPPALAGELRWPVHLNLETLPAFFFVGGLFQK